MKCKECKEEQEFLFLDLCEKCWKTFFTKLRTEVEKIDDDQPERLNEMTPKGDAKV